MAPRRPPVAPGEGGAHWCDEHRRNECTVQSKNTPETTADRPRPVRGGRCHQPAIRGTAACRMHAGVAADTAKANGEAALTRARFRDVAPDEYVDPADVLLWSVTLARIDLADYRAEIRNQAATPTSEDLDRMARLIAQAGQMSKLAMDAKVDERRVALHEKLGDRLTAFVRGLLTALGHDPNDPDVQEIARRQLELIAGGGGA